MHPDPPIAPNVWPEHEKQIDYPSGSGRGPRHMLEHDPTNCGPIVNGRAVGYRVKLGEGATATVR
jgi:hypothetical protein